MAMVVGEMAMAQDGVSSTLAWTAIRRQWGVGEFVERGLDTLNNLMTLWAESFCKFYPNVKIQIEGKVRLPRRQR
jgi:ABC-type phosphate transport system substrate-binding protein